MRITEEAPGCTKVTPAADPILKLFQLIAAVDVDSVTVSCAPFATTLAAPAVTCGAVGSAVAGGGVKVVGVLTTIAPPE